ncbi:hypothetical protein BDQ17DRAFT_1396266 [Cyathus striatus]|nr:hypothetical protein BDQ17DRAFT_1396266 [Cyathus striatus]
MANGKRMMQNAFNRFGQGVQGVQAQIRRANGNGPPNTGRPYAEGDSELVQEVIGQLIFQAGVDYETRPMVVLSASALPDPQRVNYDLLLSRILGYLDLYVEADYTVVFFAAGGRHAPSWNWVWKAYRSLKRKYRKNLKQLYIVHSSFFSKMLFSLAGAIISPKFFRKITYVSTLSELAEHVPITQIDIPPAVYKENMSHEQQISLPVKTRTSLFGVPLVELMGVDGEKGGVPRVVRDAVMYLREKGMEEEGLFRRSPQSAMLRAAKEAYDRGNVVSLHTFNDPHLAAVLLKKYLRDLPEPIIPENLYTLIRKCPSPAEDDLGAIAYVRDVILPELVPCVEILLGVVLHLLHDVSLRAGVNKMDAHNLAVVITPNLVKGSNPARDVMMCAVPGGPVLFAPAPTQSLSSSITSSSSGSEGKTTLGAIVKLCIDRYYEIFDEIRDRSEAILPRTVPADGGEGRRDDESEDIDDTMLVMPLGPTHRSMKSIQHGGGSVPVPSWATNGNTLNANKNRSRSSSSSPSPAHSFSHNNGSAYANNTVAARARRSITIGRSAGGGTVRKSSGAAVEAHGVTASGFFSPPKGAPPVPRRP